MTVPYQKDLKIGLVANSDRSTLTLSDSGDIELVEGRDKLITQLMRSIVNDSTVFRNLLNSKGLSSRLINSTLTLIMRNFKKIQISDVNLSDPTLSGFRIYRKLSGSIDNYAQISPNIVTYNFIDSGLTNGINYDYGITRIQNNVFESAYVDRLTIHPSKFLNDQKIYIGGSIVAIPSDSLIEFFVNFKKKYQATELLDKIEKIDVQQSTTDPRQYTIYVVIQDLSKTKQSLSATRMTVS